MDKDRHSELDLCLVVRRWCSSVVDVEPDPITNVNTDRLALSIAITQKFKASDGGDKENSKRCQIRK